MGQWSNGSLMRKAIIMFKVKDTVRHHWRWAESRRVIERKMITCYWWDGHWIPNGSHSEMSHWVNCRIVRWTAFKMSRFKKNIYLNLIFVLKIFYFKYKNKKLKCPVLTIIIHLLDLLLVSVTLLSYSGKEQRWIYDVIIVDQHTVWHDIQVFNSRSTSDK